MLQALLVLAFHVAGVPQQVEEPVQELHDHEPQGEPQGSLVPS